MKKILSYILAVAVWALSAPAVMANTQSVTIISPSEEATLYEGEALKVKAILENAGSVYKVAFSLNAVRVTEVYPQESLECEIKGITAGENVIKVEALTALGEVLSSDSISITVLSNQAPVILVSQLEENTLIDLSVTDSLGVSVSDNENNFKEAKAYLNGKEVLVTQNSEFDIDLSKASSGDNTIEIHAVDTYGKKGVLRKSFSVKRNMETSLLEQSFKDYKGGTPSNFINFVTNKGAAYNSVTIDEENRGTSIELSVSSLEESQDVDAHIYFEVSDGGTKPVYILNTSYYLPGNEENEHDATATLYYRDKNGSNRELVDFDKSGKLKFYGNGGTGSAASSAIAYSVDTWYDLKLVIDTLTGEYDVYLNNEPIVEGKTNTHIRDIGISAFRFGVCTRTKHGHSASDVGGKVCMDDISLVSILTLPSVEKVFSEGNENGVIGGTDEFSVKLTSPVLGTDLEENIIIESEFGEIKAESISYDAENKTINISTDANFQPGASYVLTLKKGIKITDTLKTNSDIKCSFNVLSDLIDAENGKLDFVNSKPVFSADIVNGTDSQKDVAVIMYVWNGEELVAAHAESFSALAKDTTNVSVTGKPLAKGEHITAYVFELPALENAITVKSYNFSE